MVPPQPRLFLLSRCTRPNSPVLFPRLALVPSLSFLLWLHSPSTWALPQSVMMSSEFYSPKTLDHVLLRTEVNDASTKMLEAAFPEARLLLQSCAASFPFSLRLHPAFIV